MINDSHILISDTKNVGDIILEALEAKDMKQSELSDLTGITKSVLNDVIKGRRNISAEMAVLVESALGLSADMILTIQTKNELEKAYNDAKILSQLRCMSDWSEMNSQVSTVVLKKVGLLKSNVKDKVETTMRMFHVKDLDDFKKLAKLERGQAYFKKSDKLHIDKSALFTWKYYCFDVASKVQIEKSFNRSSIDELRQELNAIFLQNNDTYNRIQQAFNGHGIRFLYIDKVGQVPVDGLSFWKDENPTVIITRRLPHIDNLAFSVMHELGHIKMHLKKSSDAFINLDGVDIDTIEAEANKYARDSFVSQEEWENFMSNVSRYNPYTVHIPIKSEANKLGVNPQILFGRYMHDTGLYRLRRVFPTEVK